MARPRLIVAAAAFALIAVLGAACGGSSSSSSTAATQTVTETQTQTQTETQGQSTEQAASTEQGGSTIYTEDTTTIDVATGDSFTIELPINPSTGYSWVPSIPMGYVQVSDDILPPDDEGNMVGQGTAERWVFSADTPGTATITFDLMPPGQGSTSEQTVTFTVNAS